LNLLGLPERRRNKQCLSNTLHNPKKITKILAT
jgi:hypothetical protein